MEQIINVLMIQDVECFSFKFFPSTGRCFTGRCFSKDATANVTGKSVAIYAQFEC